MLLTDKVNVDAIYGLCALDPLCDVVCGEVGICVWAARALANPPGVRPGKPVSAWGVFDMFRKNNGFTNTNSHTCTCTHTHTHIHTYIPAHTNMPSHACALTFLKTHTHTNTHTHTHTHTNTNIYLLTS